MKTLGTLFLIPTPLAFKTGESANCADFLLKDNREKLKNLRFFIAENAKTARAHLKGTTTLPLQELKIAELNEHTKASGLANLLSPLLNGEDVGLLSEAGCPAVADPGGALVLLAHQNQIKVEPWIGASSILLALMASGLNGQRFRFLGYLPSDSKKRESAILKIEKESQKNNETQIFIETPYRNAALFSALMANANDKTLLCVALDLTLSTETIRTQTIAEWKKWQNKENFFKNRPAVFLLLG